MQTRISILVAVGAALAAGCGRQPQEVAAAGAAPGVAVDIPVGPIPGVAAQPALMTDPYAGNPVAMMEGRHLFLQYNCVGCHGGHAGGGMGPSLRDPVWIYGGDDAHIFASIAEGRGKGMPAWGAKLPRDQIWQLVAYLKSLRTPQEPEPPR
jgi:cytochrome c oxidase cbb3-type subunit III